MPCSSHWSHQRRITLTSAARKKQRHPSQGLDSALPETDNTSQASHRHFDDSTEWDSFVQDKTGLAPPPADAQLSAAQSQPQTQKLGTELEQQNVAEAQSRGRRRTRKLLGTTAAEALGDIEARAPPPVPAPSALESSAPSMAQASRGQQPKKDFAREDFWTDRPTPQPQQTARPSSSSGKASPDSQASQQWWQELEEVSFMLLLASQIIIYGLLCI